MDGPVTCGGGRKRGVEERGGLSRSLNQVPSGPIGRSSTEARPERASICYLWARVTYHEAG
jgi:hypothetical protein